MRFLIDSIIEIKCKLMCIYVCLDINIGKVNKCQIGEL